MAVVVCPCGSAEAAPQPANSHSASAADTVAVGGARFTRGADSSRLEDSRLEEMNMFAAFPPHPPSSARPTAKLTTEMRTIKRLD